MVSRCFPGGYNVKLYISRGRLAWWLLAFLCVYAYVLASKGTPFMLVTHTIIYIVLTLKVLATTIDAQWEGMGDVGSARYEPVLLPPCPTIRVLSYSN